MTLMTPEVGTRFGGDGLSAHIVQFYEDETFLYSRVAAFLTEGLQATEPAVVIATPEHRAEFARALRRAGFDESLVTFFDARETLDQFMIDNVPDPERFAIAISDMFRRASNGSRPSRVRAYGEMVDVLWRDGNPEGAVRLEELWNELGKRHTFTLLCAYPLANFYRETDASLLNAICASHAVVIPTEAFSALASSDAQGREITKLQQRAAALEAEVAHRKELERALCEALAARREAEETLRRSERDLKDFVENATVGLHWVGADGRILWANDAELRLLGYSRDEYIGHHIAEFHADADVIEDILRRLTAKEEIRDYEARLIARNGTIKWVSINSSALFEDGRFVHTRCFTTDITDRKRLDEERRRAAEQDSFLLRLTTQLNHSLDYDATMREIESVVVPHLGERCVVVLAGSEKSEAVQRVFETGLPEIEPDGTTLTVPMRINDEVMGALVLSGAAGRYTPAELPLAVETARRAALALEHARLYALAQDANRTKDEFLATLSHELRTPLTAILGWARMLTLGGLDAETLRTALETIERSARTQASLIDDLLDLSKIVTGKLALEPELVDLNSVVDNALQTLHLAAEAKGVRVEVTGSDSRAVVMGDPTRLQQIVWNLLTNAIKFSDAGGTISVEIKRNGTHARIVVRDSGRGIRPDFLPHVFEPFRQADARNSRSHNGLGLGLAIVKHLAELHGGSVSASSRGEGQGSTFTVKLPLARARESVDETPDTEDIVDLSGKTILVVDDDSDTREIVSAILRRCGASVVSAGSVADARAVMQSRLPDVVVTDIAMPEQDGYDLLRHIGSGGVAMARIPVVALTAVTHGTAREQLSEAGFAAYIKKPVDPFQVARLIAGIGSS